MRPALLAPIFAALLATTAPAWSGILATPALPINNGANQRALCTVVNRGTSNLSGIEIRIFRSSASVADSNVTFLNAGSTAAALADAAELGVTSYVRCEVEGSGISKSKTLVTLCVIPSASIDCLAAVTAP